MFLDIETVLLSEVLDDENRILFGNAWIIREKS